MKTKPHPYKHFEKDVLEDEEELTSEGIEYFFAVKKLGRIDASDYWEAYQIKGIAVQSGRIVKELMLEKPDTKQMAMAKMELMINPDQLEIPDELKID